MHGVTYTMAIAIKVNIDHNSIESRVKCVVTIKMNL